MVQTRTSLLIWMVGCCLLLLAPVHGKQSSSPDEIIDDINVKSPRFRHHVRTEVQVFLGDTLKLRCGANGVPSPQSQWFRGDRPLIPAEEKPRVRINRWALSINRIEAGDEGKWTCKVWNNVGELYRNFTVTIIDPAKLGGWLESVEDWPTNFLPDLDDFEERMEEERERAFGDEPKDEEIPFEIPPSDQIKRAPYFSKPDSMSRSIKRPAGNEIKLDCRARAYPAPSIDWYFNNQSITKGDHERMFGNYEINKFHLKMKFAVLSDAGVYRCEVFNGMGRIQHNFTVDVIERNRARPVIEMDYPKNVTVLVGENATFDCPVRSDLTPFITWARHQKKNGSWFDENGKPHIIPIGEVPNAQEIHGRRVGNNFEGTSSKIILFNVSYEDAGQYTCMAGNEIGVMTKGAWLFVVDSLEVTSYPGETGLGVGWTTPVLIIAFIVFIVLVFVCFCFYNSYKRKKSRHIVTPQFIPVKKQIIITQRTDSTSECHLAPDVTIVPVGRSRLSSDLSNMASLCEYSVPCDPAWEIPRDKIKMSTYMLGEGAFGQVHQATLTHDTVSTEVAIKSLRMEAREQEVIDLISELEVMKSIGYHENIINLIGCCTQVGGPLYVIVELCKNGNLRNFLKRHRPIPEERTQQTGAMPGAGFSGTVSGGTSSGGGMQCANNQASTNNNHYERPNSSVVKQMREMEPPNILLTTLELTKFAWQVAKGMEYLADKKCLHRDLAARNVMVTEDWVLKIGDFGLARALGASEYYKKRSDGRLPIKWMAPEALMEHYYTIQSDVWSFGILVWEIMTLGGTPYPGVPIENLHNHLMEGLRMESPRNCPKETYELMRSCWRENAAERPSFKEIVQYLSLMLEAAEDYLEVQSTPTERDSPCPFRVPNVSPRPEDTLPDLEDEEEIQVEAEPLLGRYYANVSSSSKKQNPPPPFSLEGSGDKLRGETGLLVSPTLEEVFNLELDGFQHTKSINLERNDSGHPSSSPGGSSDSVASSHSSSEMDKGRLIPPHSLSRIVRLRQANSMASSGSSSGHYSREGYYSSSSRKQTQQLRHSDPDVEQKTPLVFTWATTSGPRETLLGGGERAGDEEVRRNSLESQGSSGRGESMSSSGGDPTTFDKSLEETHYPEYWNSLNDPSSRESVV